MSSNRILNVFLLAYTVEIIGKLLNFHFERQVLFELLVKLRNKSSLDFIDKQDERSSSLSSISFCLMRK
jgi:hypothetical protein